MATRAVVLLSGGIDSAVCLGLACWSYEEVQALTFYYGQRHANEITAAKELARQAGVPHRLGYLDSQLWRRAALCGGDGLEENRQPEAIRKGGIPTSFVPGRNVVFLSYAIALAGVLGGADVLIGATKEDATGYPDCRPAFIEAMSALAVRAVPVTVEVKAPLVHLNKAEVVQLARRMAIDLDATWSCYRPVHRASGAEPCGRCDACVLRNDALRRTTSEGCAP